MKCFASRSNRNIRVGFDRCLAASARRRPRVTGKPVGHPRAAGRRDPCAWFSLLCVTAALCRAATAHAEPQPRSEYQLEFEGAPECQDEAALQREISARVPTALRNDAATTQVRVHVGSSDVGLRGQLTIRGPEGESERDIEGSDCATVLQGIALMLAVYLDEPVQLPKPLPPAAKPPPLPAPKPPEITYREVSRPTPQDRFVVGVGFLAGGQARTGASAVLLTAAHLGIGVRFEGPGWFSPSVRLLGSYGIGPVSSEVGAPWDFRLGLLRTLACPVQYVASASVRWHACAALEVGELSASGAVKLQGASKPRLLWLGGGAELALEVVLGRRLSLEVAASSVVLGKRGRFVEESDESFQLNEVPRASVGISLSALSWAY